MTCSGRWKERREGGREGRREGGRGGGMGERRDNKGTRTLILTWRAVFCSCNAMSSAACRGGETGGREDG